MEINVMRRPDQVTRFVQRAGHGPRPYRWRDGVALRLPRRRLVIVTRQSRRDLQARREHDALEKAFRALAYRYGGTLPSQYREPEDVVGCEAMHVAARALGKVSSCPELPEWEADLTAIDFDPAVYAAKHLAV